jgi:hypothetical protein
MSTYVWKIDPGTHMRCTRLCPSETGVTTADGSARHVACTVPMMGPPFLLRAARAPSHQWSCHCDRWISGWRTGLTPPLARCRCALCIWSYLMSSSRVAVGRDEFIYGAPPMDKTSGGITYTGHVWPYHLPSVRSRRENGIRSFVWRLDQEASPKK